MKKLFHYCLLLFATASAVANSYDNMAVNSFIAMPKESGTSEIAVLTDATLYIESGTITNIKSQDSILNTIDAISKAQKPVIYITGKTQIFFGEGIITNAISIYIKTIQKQNPVVLEKKKNAVIAKHKTFQFTAIKKIANLSERMLVVAPSPAPIKNDKDQQVIIASSSFSIVSLYRKRKSTRSRYCYNRPNGFSTITTFILFSRPPTPLA